MGDQYHDLGYIVIKAEGDRKKFTRKITQLNMKLGENYPPEGHCSVLTSLEDNRCRIITVGGARRQEESSWVDEASIREFIFTADDEGVEIASTSLCKTKGGSLPPVHGAAMVNVGERIVIWGGLDLVEYRCRDDLIILEELPPTRRQVSPTFQVTYVESLLNKTPSRTGNNQHHQTGPVPSERTGHTLTKLPGVNKAILFGGVTLERTALATKRKSCKDGRFYILDMDTYEWKHVRVPLIQARAFHSATLQETDSDYSLILIGGLVFEGNLPIKREPINNVTVLTMGKNVANFALQEIELHPNTPTTSTVFLSSHATTCFENYIMISGGIQQNVQDVDPNQAPVASATAYVIDMTNKKFQSLPKTTRASSLFSTFGHSLLKLPEMSTFLVVGGSSKQISLLTDRHFEPDPCELEPCTILTSNELHHPNWVQCNHPRCRKWYHQYCLKLERVPEGNYYCPNCRA